MAARTNKSGRGNGRASSKQNSLGSSKYIPAGKARTMIGCSKNRMAELIRTGELEIAEDGIDKRFKLVRKADVLRLIKSSPVRLGKVA